MKAMLLAAGRGSRLKPLTDTMPKPLVTAGGACLIEHAIFKLKKAGIVDIVINLSYLADKIVHHLGNGQRYGVNLEYSYEGAEPLGTGGGIHRALTLLGDSPFWLLSADVWSAYTDFDQQLKTNSLAHLVMVPNPDFHPGGDYGIDASGCIIRDEPKLTYACLSLINPMLFKGCEPGNFSLSPLINRAIEQKAVTGELYQGDWFNVGTEKELARLQNYLHRFTAQDSV